MFSANAVLAMLSCLTAHEKGRGSRRALVQIWL
jgi:hypothetical protein